MVGRPTTTRPREGVRQGSPERGVRREVGGLEVVPLASGLPRSTNWSLVRSLKTLQCERSSGDHSGRGGEGRPRPLGSGILHSGDLDRIRRGSEGPRPLVLRDRVLVRGSSTSRRYTRCLDLEGRNRLSFVVPTESSVHEGPNTGRTF